MRYRDCPTAEVTVRVEVEPALAWAAVTDIHLPVATSPELQEARWVGPASEVAVGARFEGRNRNEHLGEWTTTSEVIEVEPGRRWVWEVGDGAGATWTRFGFEVEPTSTGALVRQWVRIGPGRSGLNIAIDAEPEKEARFVAGRLRQLTTSMQETLDLVKAQLERGQA